MAENFTMLLFPVIQLLESLEVSSSGMKVELTRMFPVIQLLESLEEAQALGLSQGSPIGFPVIQLLESLEVPAGVVSLTEAQAVSSNSAFRKLGRAPI